ncbi:MAG TPA: hypothetical protein VJ953_06915 [Saprospiraceae bacterium]|nr:hypothetical protein [Saprospiraceae bacterium]
MDQKTNGLSLERILLLLIIGIGCLGLSYAFQAKQEPAGLNEASVPLRVQGSFTVDTPIRFTLNQGAFSTHDLEIDFGNGTQRLLKDSRFTFAYGQAGEYILKIKQNKRVVYHTSIYITENSLKGDDLIVMNTDTGIHAQKAWSFLNFSRCFLLGHRIPINNIWNKF